MVHGPASWLSIGRARGVRRTLSGLGGLALALQIGCYSYAPAQTTPPPAPRQVGVVLNDRGRVLLGDRVGPGTSRIDGKVISQQDSSVVLEIYRVTDLRGNSAAWTGERVTIPREAIEGFRERKVSKFKSILLAGAIALAVVLTLGTSLDLFGDGITDGPNDGGPQQS